MKMDNILVKKYKDKVELLDKSEIGQLLTDVDYKGLID